MDPVTIGLTAASAVSSLVGDLFGSSDAERQKKNAINAYKKLLIPMADITRRADDVGDTIYTQTMAELNSGAFAYRGSLNPETLKSIAYGRMAGLRATEELKSKRSDEDYNRGIQSQIAQIEAQPTPSSFNPADFISAGIQGYLGGKQIEMSQDLIDKQGQFYDILSKDLGRGGATDWMKVISPEVAQPSYKRKKYTTGAM